MNYKEIINSNELNRKLYNENEKFPPSVIVESTNYCNLKCTCCGHSVMKREKGFMKLNLYKKIIDEVAKENPNTDLWMVFYGEPLTLRYKIVYLIDYAKKSGLTNVYMNSNGILLDEELSEAIIDAKLDKIVFSLDAYYEDTYKKIRNNDNFQKVKANILKLIKIKNRLESNIKIEVQLIEIPGTHREGEIEKFREYWEDKGIIAKIKPYVTWTGTIDISEMRHQKRYPCSWLFRTFVVTWNGEVAQCGCDYDGKYISGNLNTNSIKSIWNKDLKEIRDLHLEEKYNETPICKKCRDWDSYKIVDFLK